MTRKLSRMNKNIKIMHVIGATLAGGAESFVVDLAIAMADAGYQVSIFALSPRIDSAGYKQRERLNRAGVPCFFGPDEKVGVRAVFSYLKALRNYQPDIVHTHTPNTELASAIASCFHAKKYIAARTIHNTHLKSNSLYRWAYNKNRCKLSAACSQAAADSHSIFGSNIKVIPNGRCFSWPIKTTENSVEYRQKLDLDESKFHFLSVGRMDGASVEVSQKAHNIMIEAWRELRLGEGAAVLHFIGDGPLRASLELLTGDDKSIIFEGIKDNVADWLIACDVFLMPSRHEGLPIAGIEAVGTGLVCIFSDIASLRLLEPSVVKWVPVDDTGFLGNAMAEILRGTSRPIAADAADQRSRFSIVNTAQEYMNYYNMLEHASK